MFLTVFALQELKKLKSCNKKFKKTKIFKKFEIKN